MYILHRFTALLTCLFNTELLVYKHAYFTQFYWSINTPILHSVIGLLTCLFYIDLLVY